MDMKHILQALDNASTKPVEGANDMSKFLRVVKEADLNQAAEPAMPGQNMPAVQINLDHLDAKTLDSAEGFKAAMKQAAAEAGIDPSATQLVDKMVVAAPDGTVDMQKTLSTVVAQFSDAIVELVKMLQDLAISYEKGMSSPEFQQFDNETKQSVKDAFAELKAMIPKIMADAKKMSSDVKGMQAQANAQRLEEGANPHKVTLPVQMAMQHYQQESNTKKAPKKLINKYFEEVQEELIQKKQQRRELINQYAGIIAERVRLKESGEAGWGRVGMAGVGMQPIDEMPISATDDPNNPLIHGHQKANPMTLQGRIKEARNQLRELSQMAESNDLAVWQQICKLAKGGMFMGLEQNIEQIQHGINELVAKRKKGGTSSRGIDKNI